jgi:hypothetical protein
MNLILKSSLLVAFVAYSQNIFAWGATGHRSIGLIAEQHMNPAALKKAHTILGSQSLASVSNWSDEIRSEPKTYGHTFDWHYTTWQDDDERFHAGLENKASGFLLSQLNKQLTVLSNPVSSQTDKAFALKFIVHLLGDLHQPLHVGGGNDRGGNTCRVTWHGRPTNLHAVWDSDMIERSNLSYTELANFSSQARTAQQTKQWQSGSIESWAQESKMLRRKIYPPEVQLPNAPVTYLTYCQDIVAPEAMPKLGYDYSYQFEQILRDRLFQAGVRLAKVLNESL